jgi:UDP-N-acetyl-D-glucosamine dehydrogenase
MSSISPLEQLRSKISSRKAVIGVVGLGYVGLPLSVAFARAGYDTIGMDVDPEKVRQINSRTCYLDDKEVRSALPDLVEKRRLTAVCHVAEGTHNSDFIVVCVPTPTKPNELPDLGYLMNTAAEIAKELSKGKFVIVESTVYPTLTETRVQPILESHGLRAGIDFGLAYSPERMQPAGKLNYDPKFAVTNIPKVVGGINPLCTSIAGRLYQSILNASVVEVSNMRTAEMSKILENVYRYVNVSFANELALLSEKIGIDFFEVVRAASTKPFGFQAFTPGPGAGGHCIPKDALYLLHFARSVGSDVPIVRAARQINSLMPRHIVDLARAGLKVARKSIRNSNIGVFGLAYRKDVGDTRRSPSLSVIKLLLRYRAKVTAHDPYVTEAQVGSRKFHSTQTAEQCAKGADCLIFCVGHSAFADLDLADLKRVANADAVLVDAADLYGERQCEGVGLRYVGLGKGTDIHRNSK